MIGTWFLLRIEKVLKRLNSRYVLNRLAPVRRNNLMISQPKKIKKNEGIFIQDLAKFLMNKSLWAIVQIGIIGLIIVAHTNASSNYLEVILYLIFIIVCLIQIFSTIINLKLFRKSIDNLRNYDLIKWYHKYLKGYTLKIPYLLFISIQFLYVRSFYRFDKFFSPTTMFYFIPCFLLYIEALRNEKDSIDNLEVFLIQLHLNAQEESNLIYFHLGKIKTSKNLMMIPFINIPAFFSSIRNTYVLGRGLEDFAYNKYNFNNLNAKTLKAYKRYQKNHPVINLLTPIFQQNEPKIHLKQEKKPTIIKKNPIYPLNSELNTPKHIFCNNCGSKVENFGGKFCESCGKNLLKLQSISKYFQFEKEEILL
jgi:hypothetical protein